MKIYSEKTNKEYKTVEECMAAEDAWDVEQKAKQEHAKQLADTRKDRAKAIEEQYKKIINDRAEYKRLVDEFTRDYGQFHMSVKGENLADMDLFDLFKYAFTW
jgi:hypothetical protein